MVRRHRLLALVTAAAFLASCQTTPSIEAGSVVSTHAAMNDWITKASNAILEVRNDARSETEPLDAAVMDDGNWLTLQEASRSLELHFEQLASAPSILVEPLGDGQAQTARLAEIQARIDADPVWFRQLSLQMAGRARELNEAAMARNPVRAGDLIETLNEPCQTCHTRYWPESAP